MISKWTTDTNSKIYNDSIMIRHKVFIDEQKFPPDSDIDELENESEHLVIYDGDQPLATARIYNSEPNTYRIERVAVLKSARKRGLGKQLLDELEAHIQKTDTNKITLKSKGIATNFYKKYGYQAVGKEFLDYGYPHLEMVKAI